MVKASYIEAGGVLDYGNNRMHSSYLEVESLSYYYTYNYSSLYGLKPELSTEISTEISTKSKKYKIDMNREAMNLVSSSACIIMPKS